MPLSPGRRLGPYEIVTLLGTGGMGEVYRARDTRLRREVALKVLPATVSVDADRRARFEQEALAAAALNHPNILGVHDVGNEAGVFYITTELVSGETLAAIVERGPVPVRALLDIAVQIADGMAAAHAAQIVHRDLKPSNVMIAADGRVKILDFGLAKQSGRVTADADETIMVDRTEPGMVVGTVSYMSPEQARGKPVDHRSDQFSFGLVLYEMATGKKAFDRAESVQTMSAIISEEPPPIEVRLPAPLRWTIDRCLAKDPAARYESSRDLFRDLRSLRDHLSEVSTQTETAAATARRVPDRGRWWLLSGAFALGALAALSAIVLRSGPGLPDQSAYRFTPFSFEPGGQGWAVWSPDGKAVVHAARHADTAPYQVFLRYLDASTAVQLTHRPDDAYPLAWSPDSKRVFFASRGPQAAIWSLAAVGGEPEQIMPLPQRFGGRFHAVSISPDSRTVAVLAPGEDDGIWRIWISSPPGSPLRRYAPDPFATKDVFNQPRVRFSPDGKRILLLLNAGRRGEETWLLDYPPAGSGGAHAVLPDLQTYGGTPGVDWMPDNRHVVLSLQSTPYGASQLWLADTQSGERRALTSGTTGSLTPAVAPDGERLIFGQEGGNYDVVSLDVATAAVHTLIATERNELMPSWAAADPSLVYVSDRNGPNEIWLHRGDGPDRPIITAHDFPAGTTQWFAAPAISPHADRVIYDRIETGTIARLWISAVTGGTPIQLTNDSSAEFPGSWSADGASFVYYAFRDGKANLMKVKTSGQAAPVLLKADVSGNDVPSWSPTGEWIVHGHELVSPDGKTTRSLGDHHSPAYTFSLDGKLVYGLRSEKDAQVLFSIDLATGAERIIGNVGPEFVPGSNLSPTIRLSVAPDGKTLVYGSGNFKTNLWLLSGFAAKRSPWSILGFR